MFLMIAANLYLLVLIVSQSNALVADSCGPDDFFLRKINKRYLSLPTEPIIKTGVKTYTQCFSLCRAHQCSTFSYQKFGEDDFRCSVYPGQKEGRFSPSARFSANATDLMFFERRHCQVTEQPNQASSTLKGSYPLAKDCQDVKESGKLPCQVTEQPDQAPSTLKGSYPLAKDCQDVQESGGEESGIYEIANVVDVGSTVNNTLQYVFCNMEVLEGGWTVF